MPLPKGYFDRTTRIHSAAEMFEVLHKRTQGKTEPMPLQEATPQVLTERPASLQLAWMDPVKHGDGSGFQLSVGGLYSVARVKTDGQFRYEAFRRLPLPTLIGTSKTAPEARQCAQADSQRTPE